MFIIFACQFLAHHYQFLNAYLKFYIIYLLEVILLFCSHFQDFIPVYVFILEFPLLSLCHIPIRKKKQMKFNLKKFL